MYIYIYCFYKNYGSVLISLASLYRYYGSVLVACGSM